MKSKSISILSISLFIFIVVSQSHLADPTGSQLQISKDRNEGLVEIERVGYLRNVQRLDLLLNFLYCNKTVGWERLIAINAQLIHRSQQGLKRNISTFSCELEGPEEIELVEKHQCWLCTKKFKNNTYLALHYLLRHHQSFQQKDKSFLQDKTELQMVLNQKLYDFIGPNELQILFSSLALHEEINQYCLSLFSVVFELYGMESVSQMNQSRYGSFLKGKDGTEICMMIALKMYQANIWLDIGRYIGLTILILCGLGASVYLYNQKVEEKRRNSRSKDRTKRL